MPRRLRPGQQAELHTLDIATGDRSIRLSSSTVLFEAPNWSPDGSSLVVNGDGGLWRVGAEEGELESIDLGDVAAINNDHVLSPDGSVAFVSSDDGHIYSVRLDGTGIQRVTNDHGSEFRHYLHGVSPDGAVLSYIGMRIDGEHITTNVYTVPSGGGQDLQLTDDVFPDDGAEFSPNGRWIYFNSERASESAGHAQLFRMPASGGEPEQLTFDERVNWFPHPAPDGTSVAYVSFPPGTLGHPADVEVIVRVLESDGRIRDLATVFGGQGTMNVPSWHPDSTRLAFVAYPLEGEGADAGGTETGT